MTLLSIFTNLVSLIAGFIIGKTVETTKVKAFGKQWLVPKITTKAVDVFLGLVIVLVVAQSIYTTNVMNQKIANCNAEIQRNLAAHDEQELANRAEKSEALIKILNRISAGGVNANIAPDINAYQQLTLANNEKLKAMTVNLTDCAN